MNIRVGRGSCDLRAFASNAVNEQPGKCITRLLAIPGDEGAIEAPLLKNQR